MRPTPNHHSLGMVIVRAIRRLRIDCGAYQKNWKFDNRSWTEGAKALCEEHGLSVSEFHAFCKATPPPAWAAINCREDER